MFAKEISNWKNDLKKLDKWITTALFFFASINLKVQVDAFHWSSLQESSHFISSRIGSRQELPCNYILTSEEAEQATNFFVVTWSREKSPGSNRWTGIAARSVDSFSASQDLSRDDAITLSASSSSLFISNVTKSNSGNYQCELRSSFYTSPSVIRLDVHFKPEGTKLVLARISENQTAELRCSVSSSNPPPKYRFYHNSVLLGTRDSGIYQLADLPSLKVGIYKCIAFNSIGDGPESVTYTSSDDPPRDQRAPAFITGSVIGLVLLFVLSVGSLICWRRIGKSVQAVKVDDGSMEMTRVTDGSVCGGSSSTLKVRSGASVTCSCTIASSTDT